MCMYFLFKPHSTCEVSVHTPTSAECPNLVKLLTSDRHHGLSKYGEFSQDVKEEESVCILIMALYLKIDYNNFGEDRKIETFSVADMTSIRRLIFGVMKETIHSHSNTEYILDIIPNLLLV